MTDEREDDRDEALDALTEKAGEDAEEYRIPAADLMRVWEIGLTVYLAEREVK